MKRKLLPLLAFLALCAIQCQNPKQEKQATTDTLDTPVEGSAGSTLTQDAGCRWLKQQVAEYFSAGGSMEKMAAMTTPEYFQYKMDATNVDLDTDGSLSKADFEKKWKDTYNTIHAGIGSGFLISGQDWGNIIVSTCDMVKADSKQLTVKALLSDCEFQTDYHREITLIKNGDGFRIQDVKEFD